VEKKEYIPKSNKEVRTMAEKCRKELVDALIKNKATKFTKDNREWLLTLKEDQLKLLEIKEPEKTNESITVNLGGDTENEDAYAESLIGELDLEKISKSLQEAVNKGAKDITVNVKKKEKPTKDPSQTQTVEQYIENAPAEMKDLLNSGLNMHRDKKDKMIKGLLENKRNKFTEDQLKAKDLTQLEALVELAQVEVDFSARTPSASGADEEEVMLPLTMESTSKKKEKE